MIDLPKYLEERRRRTDLFFESHFLQTPTQGSPFSRLQEAVRYSLLAGGKRIRPVLTWAAYEACLLPGIGDSQREQGVLHVAAAIEMIHTYSLIHDDLPAMDNDDLRRGRPTNHKVYGEAMAILAGDALLTEAFLVISGSPGLPAPVLIDLIHDIAAASGGEGMAGGQAFDLGSEGRKISPQELELLHRHKTGRLIEVALTSGAKMAVASGASLSAIKRYGESIGLAFQIADDILDVEGGAKEMGKSTGGDAKKEKATYPSIMGLAEAKSFASELVGKALEAIREMDQKADPLRGLARYIISRKN